MQSVTVIGAGTMGNGIAHVFAQNGYSVNLIDISEAALDRGLSTIGRNMDRQIKKEKITEVDKTAALARINPLTNLQEGVSGCDLVVEAATENKTLKLSIFKAMDAY